MTINPIFTILTIFNINNECVKSEQFFKKKKVTLVTSFLNFRVAVMTSKRCADKLLVGTIRIKFVKEVLSQHQGMGLHVKAGNRVERKLVYPTPKFPLEKVTFIETNLFHLLI